MTKEELNRRRMMFQINAKRNELLKPENTGSVSVVRHSATNDFLAFRKKVAAGMKKQKEQNVEVFNVTAANLQNYQDMLDNNELIHAGMNNQYIAKLDDFYGKGKPRYFYDQAEWDNYRKNMQGAGQAGADRGAREGADAKAQKNEKQLAQNTQALKNAVQSFKDTKSYNEAASKTDDETKKYFNNINNTSLANIANNAYNKSWTDSKRNKLLNDAQGGREESINNSKKNADREKFLEANKSGREASMNGSSTKAFNDAKNKELANKAQEAFNNTGAANTEYRTTTDAYKNKELLASNQKSKENAIKRSDPEYQKELDKAKSIKSDKDRWAAYSQKDIESVTSNDKRFNSIKTEDDAVNYPGGVEKLYKDIETALEEKYPGKKKNYEASKNAGADRAKKESAVEKEKEAKAADRAKKLEEQQNKKEEAAKSGTKTAESYTEQVKRNTDWAKKLASKNDDGSLDEAGKDYVDWVKEESLKDLKTPERHQMEKDIIKDAKKPGATYEDLSSKYGIPVNDIRTVLWFNGIEPPADNKKDLDRKRSDNRILNKWSKEDAIANSKKGAKHDGLEDGITTDAMTPDQEYIAFRKKVEAGIKHFGTTRGLMSIPKNQALADGDSMSHAGIPASYKKLATGLNNMKNYGYYNKIDNAYGPGKPRYFYSKDEWDAYQREKNKMLDKAKADVKARNEATEAARPKSNVEQAQYARQQEEKKGQREIQYQQEKDISKKTIKSADLVSDILTDLSVYGSKEIANKVEDLRKKYDFKGGLGNYGNGPFNYHQDEEYRKLMDPYIKGDKTVDRSENINADNDFNRMRQIEHEYSQKYYKDLMNDVQDIVHSDPKNAEWLMQKIMSSSNVKNAMTNNNEVYDTIINALKELNVSTAGFKPIEVKEIEVKPIEVKKIK